MKFKRGFIQVPVLVFIFFAINVIGSAMWVSRPENSFSLRSKAANTVLTKQFAVVDNSDTYNENNGKPDLYNTKINPWLGTGGASENQYLGIHLTGDPIPKGSNIISAQLELVAPEQSWIQTNFEIFAEASQAPGKFSDSKLPSASTVGQQKLSVRENVKWLKDQTYAFDVTEPIAELIQATGTLGPINLVIKGSGQPFARKFVVRNSPVMRVEYELYTSPSPTPIPATSTPTATATPKPSSSPSPTPTTKPGTTPTPTKVVTPSKPPTPTPTQTPGPVGDRGEYPTISTTVPSGQVAPVAGEKCPDWLHAEYQTTGPDGKKYATWHPTTEPFWGCTFWHEHGSDPRKFIGYQASGMPSFGYVVGHTQIPSPHNGYKVYVVNDNTRGKAMLRTLHYGTGSPLRAQIRWHELQIVIVSKAKPNEILVNVHQMMDFGHAASCGEPLGQRGAIPDRSGYDNIPYSTLDTKGKGWAGAAIYRAINMYCPNMGLDGDIKYQRAYEQWQGAINIGDLFRTVANYNLGRASTYIDPKNLDIVRFHCANDPSLPTCPAGNSRQFKYFGEIVSNSTGNAVVYANPFGKLVASSDPMAIKQYITINGWDTFGSHKPDGVRSDLNFTYYRRFGLDQHDGVYIPGNNWYAFGQGIVRWPN